MNYFNVGKIVNTGLQGEMRVLSVTVLLVRTV